MLLVVFYMPRTEKWPAVIWIDKKSKQMKRMSVMAVNEDCVKQAKPGTTLQGRKIAHIFIAKAEGRHPNHHLSPGK
ncbi:Hypothetical predicted protein [Podarcis lilfordi]|uniref:Uncharacterized protein n=1 Tax=Podarcis lilfordi TaxID=74358 RepID=A0AA35L1W6_9SAUR|nr:Hypothetical predicted protein [Podarcis lilfordi]